MTYTAVAPLPEFTGTVDTASGDVRLIPRCAKGDDQVVGVGESVEDMRG